MLKRAIALAALSIAATATTTAIAPGAAFADGANRSVCWIKDNGQRGGCGTLQTYGEVVTSTDAAADGWGTRAQIQVYSNGYWVDHSHNCFDDTSQGSPETTCNYSITDGTTIRLHVWASHSGTFKADVYSATTTA